MTERYHRYWREEDPFDGDEPPEEIYLDPSMAGATDIRQADRLAPFAADDRVWVVDNSLRTVPRSLERVAKARKHQLKHEDTNDAND